MGHSEVNEILGGSSRILSTSYLCSEKTYQFLDSTSKNCALYPSSIWLTMFPSIGGYRERGIWVGGVSSPNLTSGDTFIKEWGVYLFSVLSCLCEFFLRLRSCFVYC